MIWTHDSLRYAINKTNKLEECNWMKEYIVKSIDAFMESSDEAVFAPGVVTGPG